LGANKIGTTKKGIGPCYTDKMARQGIRVGDLISNDFEKMYKETLKIKNTQLNLYIMSAHIYENDFKRGKELINE